MTVGSGVAVADGFRLHRCLNPIRDSVSDPRSSNWTCSFPASSSPTEFTPQYTAVAPSSDVVA